MPRRSFKLVSLVIRLLVRGVDTIPGSPTPIFCNSPVVQFLAPVGRLGKGPEQTPYPGLWNGWLSYCPVERAYRFLDFCSATCNVDCERAVFCGVRCSNIFSFSSGDCDCECELMLLGWWYVGIWTSDGTRLNRSTVVYQIHGCSRRQVCL